ncbi:MAG: hypothetical protein ACRC92_02905 [Peptostreptococcaceae bacterium]
MANPLAKSIMNNISKKKNIKPKDNTNDLKNSGILQNINQEEEEILKSILYKNKSKVNINTLKNENLNKTKSKEQVIEKEKIQKKSTKTSLKDLANKNEVKEYSNKTNSKDKQNKKIISLKDLAK